MGTKAEELHWTGCFAKAADDEPLFVLRAQDVLAPDVVRQWADGLHTVRCGYADHSRFDCTLPKVVEARALARKMEAWPTRKLPD